jgi:hypothetical protein
MDREEFENWFWWQVCENKIPRDQLDTAAKAWQASRARLNPLMSEMCTTNNLQHWRCISRTSNKWWVRADGLEVTLDGSKSLGVQLINVDKNIPMQK